MQMPRCRVVTEADDFVAVYREVAGEVVARGNLAPDAHLAALARAHGIRTIYTHDRDFSEFAFLKVFDPLAWLSTGCTRQDGAGARFQPALP